jgi:hypothetical protein
MQCPRCKSSRIQLGYKAKSLLSRLAGNDEFLCNNCSLEFKSFDSSGKVKRKPSSAIDASLANRRRAPRYQARLAASISLAEKDSVTGKLELSKTSRGRCETISKVGMALSFTGSQFTAADLRSGHLLFVTVTLPNGPVDAVVKIATHDRIGKDERAASWFVRGSIVQMNDGDTARLLSYLEKRGNEALLKRE